MATRALIGTIQTDAAGNQVLTSTYNHYDGYPENLGVGLNKFYDQTSEAIKISNRGYISYLNPETGDIEAKNQEPADETLLPDEFDEAMRKVYSVADSYGADYVYLYDFDDAEWVFSTMMGSKNLISNFSNTGIENQFEGYEGGDLADEDSIRNMEENITNESNQEESIANYIIKYYSNPKTGKSLIDDEIIGDFFKTHPESTDQEPKDALDNFQEFLSVNYEMPGDYMQEKVDNKSSMEESLKNKWQHRAGIIK